MALVNKLQFEIGRKNRDYESKEEKQKRLSEEENRRRKNALDDYRSQREIKYEYDLKLLEKSFELQKESDERKYELELKLLSKRYEFEKELAEIKTSC
jgi:hypothetical protein